MSETVVLLVRWDGDGLPEVMSVIGNTPVVDIVHALALAQVSIAKQTTHALGQALSEKAHFQALLDAEREQAPTEPEASPAEPEEPA